MSWDNVKGVSVAQIWTDNPDMTQVYLFANGNHQVKLTVGLSFTLSNTTQPGPTADEVKAALSLVDYETGAGVRFVKTGAKGSYDYVYQPNMPATINVLSASDTSNPGAYQYELDYYVSSDSTINVNYASEKVALYLSYINSSGTKVDYYTSSGSKSQSYVAVTVYPPKKYGMSGSNMTPVVFNTLNDNPSYTTDKSSFVDTFIVHSVQVYGLAIDDSYFRFVNYQAPNTRLSPAQFRQIIQDDYSAGDTPGYKLSQGFLLKDNNVKSMGESYSALVGVMDADTETGEPNGAIAELEVEVYQQFGQIIFINFDADVSWFNTYGDKLFKESASAKFTAFDQFGNPANIEVGAGNSPTLALSSVS